MEREVKVRLEEQEDVLKQEVMQMLQTDAQDLHSKVTSSVSALAFM